ncbi:MULTISPECIES: polysaccharide deacetylase family protein [Niastella]|uniref:Polysaccharide deacetylase family protein n=1 Tax=Niastella soli TaxID=2821487 RepID=A0ABS3YLR4_9BACT|nr:polysaccharide deacetylase family protein [Niastella soli]MBO9198818.1 polysaccharide deacetylase family protein [Niastella soli]
MVYLIIPVAILVITFILMYLYAGPFYKGLPVLVYHKISSTKKPDFLTVSASSMREHLEYINRKGYNTIFLSDMIDYIEKGTPLPPKPIMITLDDGFRDNYTDLYPLLKEFNCKANIFIVAGFVQTPDNLGPRTEGEFMLVEEAKDLCSERVQYGLHTMYHKSYHHMTLEEIDEDMRQSKQRLDELGIPYQPVFAYSFAAHMSHEPVKQKAVFGILKKYGVRYAFKVGDRLNKISMQRMNPFLLNRLTITGSYNMFKFRMATIGFIRIVQRFERIMK